jgi:hypothetical protein
MRDAALPITLIVVGAVWLAWYMGWLPDRDWTIAIGFCAAGIGVMAIDGITKKSVVMGPFLIAIGIAWLVHDRYRTSFGIIVPAMLVVLGVLMLIARSAAIPDRRAGAKTPPSN